MDQLDWTGYTHWLQRSGTRWHDSVQMLLFMVLESLNAVYYNRSHPSSRTDPVLSTLPRKWSHQSQLNIGSLMRKGLANTGPKHHRCCCSKKTAWVHQYMYLLTQRPRSIQSRSTLLWSFTESQFKPLQSPEEGDLSQHGAGGAFREASSLKRVQDVIN